MNRATIVIKQENWNHMGTRAVCDEMGVFRPNLANSMNVKIIR